MLLKSGVQLSFESGRMYEKMLATATPWFAEMPNWASEHHLHCAGVAVQMLLPLPPTTK